MKYMSSRQSGDTIVEVVIAVLVVSTIIAGAFAVTNRSTRAVRDSEEHAQALQLLQGQVEYLRNASTVRSSLPNNLTTPFCYDGSGYHQPAATSSQCLLNNLYRVSITSPTAVPATGATTTFNLIATWSALGGGTANVYLSYKVEVAP